MSGPTSVPSPAPFRRFSHPPDKSCRAPYHGHNRWRYSAVPWCLPPTASSLQCQIEVGKALVEHPGIPVISFTGSTETGSFIGETCGRMHKRLSLEMGGKNAMIVMDDADLDLALEGVLWGAFGTTGQRCTATSRLIVHSKVHDTFIRGWLKRRNG